MREASPHQTTTSRSRYYSQDLQVFNMQPRISGGAYWFWHGWNPAAMLAWVPATVVGMLFVNTTLYVGPWANSLGGIDLSFLSSAVIGGLLYLVLVRVLPNNIVVPAAVSEQKDAARLAGLRQSATATASRQNTALSSPVPADLT